MELLNKIVSYWYDCIKNEDILEKDISINVRTKAVLYPFDYDPFVFDRRRDFVALGENEKLLAFSQYIQTEGYEAYYGYPLLFYFDDQEGKHIVAPLFITKVQFSNVRGQLYLAREEESPTCGIQALTRLGLRTEEIAEVSQNIDKLFKVGCRDSTKLADDCLAIIQKETFLQINERIVPETLTNSKKLSKDAMPGIYNKSMVFAGENTPYNLNLLQDLLELKNKKDLEQTSLSFIMETLNFVKEAERVPILPFPSNEYQIRALQQIFGSKLSVITGPPGTGKSQFISNLLVNLFLEGKSVLFVSHTNEAVDVVDKKLNEQFRNLMLRTGKKEFRQELKGRFNELVSDLSKAEFIDEGIGKIEAVWRSICDLRQKLSELDHLEDEYENKYWMFDKAKSAFFGGTGLEQSFAELSTNAEKLQVIKNKLESIKTKLDNNSFSLWQRFFLFFFPQYAINQAKRLFVKLNAILPLSALRILQNQIYPDEIKDYHEQGWLRLSEYLDMFECFSHLETTRKNIERYQPRSILESSIREMEQNFYEVSRRIIKRIYVGKMIGKGEHIGRVNSFLHQVDASRARDEYGLSDYLFEGALKVLKVWSCTLKSVRRTFPLSPGIFDFVIFDESSQVDLPSAAPALYRAKRAIVVGDPMQLTHIAGITKDMDKALAKVHGLTEKKDIYPHKVRYCDVSLYKSAESSLTQRPILLTNHYRSEDQIITLCNRVFYGGRLKIMTTLDYSIYPSTLPIGVYWLDCKGEAIKHPAGSRVNHQEVSLVTRVFKDVLTKISHTNLTIGVVTPYSRQQDAIQRSIIESMSPDVIERHKIKILTAHEFQGSEKIL